MLTKPSFLLTAAISLFMVVPGGIPAAVGDEPAKTTRCILKLTPEIDCPSCEDRLHYIVAGARGVQSADVDVLTDRIVVRYDPLKVSVKALIGRIAVTGYTATEVK